ncbi:FtsK/SpoIIIE family DNA translocase [Deinococcus koreensis]|uniref:Cell division protein FtsK n=1 Tax=Deinococcus koreensis TaxID=2054903 RepID=A0A2K3V126_9DEIO|nr:DNA translocase FtsK [Deinococcus koreensis]PNY82485.1 cell division protein FtsK [Deinococcus koreensis]
MAKARAKSAPPVGRFDGEALGLVLFALGIFLAVTLLLEQGESTAGTAGFMGQSRGLLLLWLGWGAYLLPIVPVAYGVLVFLGRDLRNLTRRVLGGAVVVLSVLALQETLQPGESGRLAELAMTPLFRALSYLAALLPLVTLTLGLELMLRYSPFALLKTVFRRVSVLLGGASAGVQGAIEARQEGREAARLRSDARQQLAAQARDLETLRRLYPQAKELKSQQDEIRTAQRGLRALDETGLKHLERDQAAWREVSKTFVNNAARDLREDVTREAPDAGATVETIANEVRAGRHELCAELPSTLASGALERLRRSMVMEVQRLAQRAGRLERERKAAEKALARADTAILAREWAAHKERVGAWRLFSEDFSRWQARAGAYAGWPELSAAFDRAPTEVAGMLAEAITADPDGTLADPGEWRARLAQAQEEARRRAEAMSTRSESVPPTLDIDFTGGLTAGSPPHRAEAPAFPPPPAHALIHGSREPVNLSAPGAPGLNAALWDEADAEPLPTSALSAHAGTSPDPFSGWDDDDLPFGPAQEQSARPPARPLAAVPPRPAEPLLGGGGVQATATRAAASAPWEDSDERGRVEPRPVVGALPLALPGYDLLDPVPLAAVNTAQLDAAARQRAGLIDETLRHFNLQAKVVDYARGPTVTRYEIEPAPGEKISRIASLSNDLARALAVGGVRVEAPVPGKSVIGLEVPNTEREPVTFHQAAAAPGFRNTRAKLPVILGKSIDGELMVGDLAKMPHLLVAGSTGSGKSVCVNTLITSLLFKYLPTELRFLMIDPKMVELTPYDGIPHLVRSVVTNPVDAAGVLLGAVAHMERRYKMMSQVGAKNLEQFNAKMRQTGETELPHLVIIIDELADLMITSPKEVESAIMRLAQMARATGMHLILATQRPSVDILTSLIKVNVPARIAFAVSSSHDSRTILDAMGAERLTGMGDMLFYQPGLIKPLRLQGPYISELESVRISDELRRQVFEDVFVETYGADFDGGIEASGPTTDRSNMDFSDPLLRQAAQICIEEGQGSVSRLQRRLSVGHARAGKLMDMLESMGIVSKHQGSKPRDILITEADLSEYFGR